MALPHVEGINHVPQLVDDLLDRLVLVLQLLLQLCCLRLQISNSSCLSFRSIWLLRGCGQQGSKHAARGVAGGKQVQAPKQHVEKSDAAVVDA